MWSLPIRQSVRTSGGVSYEKPSQTENDTLIISTDSNPSPGVSRVSIVANHPGFEVNGVITDCKAICQGRCHRHNPYSGHNDWLWTFLPANGNPSGYDKCYQGSGSWYVITSRLLFVIFIRSSRVDGTERQIIKDMDGTIPRPKIRACSISDPFVLIFREDDTIGLFIGETERGKIRRKDMSPMGDKVRRSHPCRVRR